MLMPVVVLPNTKVPPGRWSVWTLFEMLRKFFSQIYFVGMVMRCSYTIYLFFFIFIFSGIAQSS